MKHLKRLLGLILAICMLLGTAAAVSVEDVPLLGKTADAVPASNGFIVKLRNDGRRAHLQAEEALEPIAHAADYFTAQTIEEVAPLLEAGLVESLDENVRVELFDDEEPPLTNDPNVTKQWYLKNINAPTLWASSFDGSGVKVALIDSGVMDTHEDLAGANIAGRNFCGEIVEDVQQHTDKYQDTNSNGHGTAVAGIIAARRGNALGIAGLLENVQILSLRCFAPDNTAPENVKGNYVDTVISAVGYAMEQGADVINMSLGVKQQVTALEKKLREAAAAGILLVAAAGNYGVSDPDTAVYPASYDFVVSVAATRSDNLVMDSSQKNSQVTIAAPGNAIYSTSNNGAYAELSGTSLSSPVAAALAAVVKQKDGKIDFDGFVRLMQRSAIDRGDSGRDNAYGWGVVDAATLLSALDAPYILTYNTDGGKLPAEYLTLYQIAKNVGAELPTPTRGSHDVFAGWYLDEALTKGPHTTLPAGCAGNLTLYAAWKQEQLAGASVKLVGLTGMEDVTATQDESGKWTALLPAGTTASFIAALTAANIEITGVEATAVTKAAADGTKWSFKIGDTPYELNIPQPTPLRVVETWEGTATPASVDGKTAAVACRMPVADWFTGEILAFSKATADLPAAMGSLGMTADRKTMVFTPTAAAAGQTLTARIYARNAAGLSEPVTATIVVGAQPASKPVVADAEKTFEQGGGDLPVALTLYGSAVTGVSIAGTALPADAYAVEGETLTLKSAWLNTLELGSYALTVTFATETTGQVVLKVCIPKPAVTLDPATREGTATPASADGVTAAVAYEEDVASWFSGQVDSYTGDLTGGEGTMSFDGTTFRYTPVAADAGKTVTIAVTAKNTTGTSAPVTATVTVGAAPFSDPVVVSTALNFKKTLTVGVDARVTWNGATLTKLFCNDEEVDAAQYTVSKEDNTLTLSNAWLRSLTVGSYTLKLCFADCRTENLTLPLPLVVYSNSDSSGGTGGGSVIDNLISGLAGASSASPSVTIPEANVTIFYTPDGGKATLTVEDSESAAISKLNTISLTFPAGDVVAAELSEAIWKAPQVGTLVKFPSGSFFMRSTAPVSGNRTVSMSSPAQNMWYISFTGDPAGVTALLPCAAGKWKAVLRTANGERNLPCVYDTNNSCLRVVLPESGTLAISLETAGNPFTDVAAGAWYYDAVQSAYSAKLLQGVSGTLYAPDTAVSRAMLVTILWRLSGSPANAETPFKDVASGAWYAAAAAWAQKQGLVNGYPDGSFRPDAPVSRQELMTILWRFAAKQGAAKVTGITAIADYADVKTIAEYAVSAVSGMVEHGIVNGVGTKPARLAPAEGATRAQLAVILQRFVEYLSGK